MAIRETTWRPDTCGCEIVYQWDDSVAEAQRTHEVSGITKRCAAHASHDDQNGFTAVIDENKRKNIAFEEVKKIVPALTPEFFKYEFDGNRVLKITLTGPSQAEKAQIAAALNAKFGSGKTKVE
jgi:hypothetical protein